MNKALHLITSKKNKAVNFEDLPNYNHNKCQDIIFVVYDIIWANKIEYLFTTISAVVLVIVSKIIISLKMKMNDLRMMTILSFNDKWKVKQKNCWKFFFLINSCFYNSHSQKGVIYYIKRFVWNCKWKINISSKIKKLFQFEGIAHFWSI